MQAKYREAPMLRVSKNAKNELREASHRFNLRISDFSRAALMEGLRAIKQRGTLESQDVEQAHG